MFKLIFLFLLAVPLYGQVSVPIGTRANVEQRICNNIGGSENCILVNSAGKAEVNVATDGTAGIGNVYSDYPNMPAISGSTCTGGSPTTINPVTVTRIGNIVTMMGQINNSGCNAGEVFFMALPIARTSGNFNTTEGAHGLFTSKTDGGLGTIESNNGAQTVRFTMGASTGGGRLGFTFSYSMVN